MTARPPKRLAQLRSVSHALFNFAKAPVKNVKIDAIWQPTLQRQLGVTTYIRSTVINLFKQKAVSQNDLFATVTLHNNFFWHRLSHHLHCTNCYVHVCGTDSRIICPCSLLTGCTHGCPRGVQSWHFPWKLGLRTKNFWKT